MNFRFSTYLDFSAPTLLCRHVLECYILTNDDPDTRARQLSALQLLTLRADGPGLFPSEQNGGKGLKSEY